jgi:hypothetical protein
MLSKKPWIEEGTGESHCQLCGAFVWGTSNTAHILRPLHQHKQLSLKVKETNLSCCSFAFRCSSRKRFSACCCSFSSALALASLSCTTACNKISTSSKKQFFHARTSHLRIWSIKPGDCTWGDHPRYLHLTNDGTCTGSTSDLVRRYPVKFHMAGVQSGAVLSTAFWTNTRLRG